MSSPDGAGGPETTALPLLVPRSRLVPAVLAAFVAGVLLTTSLTPAESDETQVATAPQSAAVTGADTRDASGAGTDTTEVAAGTAVAGTASGAPEGAASIAPASGSRAPAGVAAPVGGPASASPVTGSGTPAAVNAAPAGGNGGATAPGVTEKAIKLTHLSGDSASVGAVCPRCGNDKSGSEGGAVKALLAAWRRDGKLPIYGRDLEVTTRSFELLSAEAARNSCVQAVQVDKPFAVISGIGQFTGDCVAREFKKLYISGQSVGDDDLLRSAPRIVQVYPTRSKVWRNYVEWLDRKGLLKGQVLGMYSPADSSTTSVQDSLTKSFRQELAAKGYKLAVDMTYDLAQSASTDTVAVQRFMGERVTVALIFGALTEPSGFQNRAEALGYRPKYPVAETGNETTDAVADVGYNAEAQNRNLGLKTERWEWAARRPATPAGNETAAYCLKAYQDFYKRQLDVFDHDAEIHTIQHDCSVLEVLRQALINAGPNLTERSFFEGLYKIKNFETSDIARVSYAPGKHAGSDVFADTEFRKERFPASNNYWGTTSPWFQAFKP